MKSLRIVSMIASGALLLSVTACGQSEAEFYIEKGKIVQACVDSGGEWFNTPGWGEDCNYDTRD